MSLTVAILCGGLGTRLLPLTRDIPKALAPVAGKPFIDYQLELLASQGIERVVLCAGYLGERIVNHVGDGHRFGLKDVSYAFDGPQALGTAGAIRNALPMLGETFGVLYGDVYPLYDVQAIALTNMGVMAVRAPGRGNVGYVDGLVLAYDRRGGWPHGDAGFSVFNANAFVDHPQLDLGDVLGALASFGELDGCEVTDPVYEIGSFEGFSEFERYVLHSRLPV